MRLVVAVLLLAAAVAASVHWASRDRLPPPEVSTNQWIPLPEGGMDAEDLEVRRLIASVLAYGVVDPLSITCGDDRVRKTGDRYIAHIGEDAFHPSWRIVLDIDGDNIDIAWSMDGMTGAPPPPPTTPPHGPSPRAERTRVVPTARTVEPRAKLESIRAAWNDPDLWHSPQDPAARHCLDGDPVILEACVGGRYAARARNCNAAASSATRRLWAAFNELLPAPPPAEWRDTDGRRTKAR